MLMKSAQMTTTIPLIKSLYIYLEILPLSITITNVYIFSAESIKGVMKTAFISGRNSS